MKEVCIKPGVVHFAPFDVNLVATRELVGDPEDAGPRSTAAGSRSVIVIAPVSSASGRSIEERNFTAGNPRIVDPSAIVPESDYTQAALICSRL